MSFELFDTRTHIARKPHRCQWCGEWIHIGEHYMRYVGKCDGDFQSTAMHGECYEAMQKSDLYEDYLPGEKIGRGKTTQEWIPL